MRIYALDRGRRSWEAVIDEPSGRGRIRVIVPWTLDARRQDVIDGLGAEGNEVSGLRDYADPDSGGVAAGAR